ncbi:WD40/YVTN/BNR-like repeat-containing protein [Caenimonas soli]|uniref:WD40/YVTN/BNR-like repeat-containing protein n=1 Tax=Caenimonas soli TaxID=2735555 RepID=UPI001552E98D|nr:YCF48-related protein [Caenimonas soli]NPC55916.1 hypothetical protein [Caenimonas soli]
MVNRSPFRWPALAAAVLFGVLQLPVRAQVDPLQRPARSSAKAAGVAQLAVTQAGRRLVSVGERGVILYSDDDGVSWKQAAVPVSVTLTQVSFPAPELGWAVGHGGVVLHSTDAGATWSRKLDGVQAAQLVLDAVKLSSDPTIAAGKAMLADAQRLVTEGADKPWLDVLFTTGKRGILVGAYGLALATEDGGMSWRSWTGRIPNPKGRHLYSVAAVDERIVLVGEQGSVFSSDDGGKTFAAHPTPYSGTYFGVLMLNKERWLAYGMVGNAWLTTDSGISWTQVDTRDAGGASFTHGRRLPDGTVLLGTNGGDLLASRDHGRSFRKLGATRAGPVLGFAALADGALVLTGLRGPTRVSAAGPGSAR